jgi:hypothetical protein
VFLGYYFSVLLRLPLSPSPLFLCRAPPLLCRPCAAPPPLLRCSRPSHVPLPPSATAFPEPRCLLPAVPRRPAVCPSHPSPQLVVATTPRHLLLSDDPTCHSPASRRRSLPQLSSSARATPIPPLPELRRAATRAAGMPAPACA